MQDAYGYPMPTRMATRLHTLWLQAMFDPVTHPTVPEEVQPLGALLDWDRLLMLEPSPTMMDPCAGNGNILAALAEELPWLEQRGKLINNDINTEYDTHLHFDCMTEEDWIVAPQDVDVFICSPPFQLIDILLPLLVQRARICVALHVPADYISNGPAYRRMYWSYLQHEGRIAEIRGLCRVKDRPTRRCAWILVFASQELKEALWQSTVDSFTLSGE